jgi:hypothetical protein
MQNDCRGSDIKKRQSHRRTLLCYSTLCVFSCLIFFIIYIELFHKRLIYFQINSNKTISLNLLKFRSSLIECGQSVIEKENFYQNLEKLIEIIKNLNKKNQSLNEELNKNFLKEKLIISFDFILNKCFKARQFSLIEQQKPMIITQFISFLRKEFLYIAAFFIKDI